MKGTRLDVRLAELGLAVSREQAQGLIMAGLVQVDGQRVDKAGSAVATTARIDVLRPLHPYVSRGGVKLQQALDTWPIPVQDKVALDVGASTGGFTHCMLQRGARKVYAIDVGYGQLDYSLRQDARVVAHERVNARYLTAETIPELVDLLTIDVSFISLTLVLPAVMDRLHPEGHCVALVKPQFEAGRGQVGRGGVVRDPDVHRQVLVKTGGFIHDHGWQLTDIIPSPLKGPNGNIEFLCWVKKTPTTAQIPVETLADKAVQDGSSTP